MPGLRIQFEMPVFTPKSSDTPGAYWLCELSDAAHAVGFARGSRPETIDALAETAWGCILLLEFGHISFWNKYWDKLRSHLPSFFGSGAIFVNGYGIASTNLYLVSGELQRMSFRSTGLRPEHYREDLPVRELLPDYATLVAIQQAQKLG